MSFDVIHQVLQHSASQPLVLMFWQDRHVGDVEIPTTISYDAAHGNNVLFTFCAVFGALVGVVIGGRKGDVASVPAVVGNGGRLGECFWVQARYGTEVDVSWDWRETRVDGVPFWETRVRGRSGSHV